MLLQSDETHQLANQSLGVCWFSIGEARAAAETTARPPSLDALGSSNFDTPWPVIGMRWRFPVL
jgi:hypothetical protein